MGSKSKEETKKERSKGDKENLLLLQSFDVCVFVVDELQSRGDDLGFVAAFYFGWKYSLILLGGLHFIAGVGVLWGVSME